MKVLVVNDSMYIRSLVKFILEKHDHKIIGEASTGEQAIDMYIELEPDYVVLDDILPDMKGEEVVHALIKGGESLKALMVCEPGQGIVQKLILDFASIEFIEKPFNAISLMKAVNKVLNVNV